MTLPGAEAVFQQRTVEIDNTSVVFRRINLATEAYYAEFLKERAKQHLIQIVSGLPGNTQIAALVELATKAATGEFRWLGESCVKSFTDDYCLKHLLFLWLQQDNQNVKREFSDNLFSKQPKLIEELIREFIFENPSNASSKDPSAAGAPQ